MDSEEKYRRTHPYSLIRHIKIYAILLVISLLQQFFVRPQGVIEILGSLGINALYVLIVLAYFITEYLNHTYKLSGTGIDIYEGILIKRSYTIPFDKIRTVVLYRNAFSDIFGAVRISADTPAGFRKKYDFSAYFSRKKAASVRSLIEGDLPLLYSFRSRIICVILMSAFWANPVTGIIFIVPVIQNIGMIVGNETAQRIIRGSIDYQWIVMTNWISPAAALVASVILLCWMISMFTVFLRFVRFRSMRIGDRLLISKGFITRSEIYTKISGISSVSIDQSLFMKLLRLKSCSVSVIGSGKIKGDRSLLLSADNYDCIQNGMTHATGIPNEEKIVLRRAKRSLFSYVYFPLIVIGGDIALIFLSKLMSLFKSSALLLLYIFLFLSLWWLMFRIFAYFHSRISLNDKCLIICTFNKLTLKKHYIPFEMIQQAEITRTPFQRRSGKCSVKVRVYFEKKMIIKVKQLPYDAAADLLRQMGIRVIEKL